MKQIVHCIGQKVCNIYWLADVTNIKSGIESKVIYLVGGFVIPLVIDAIF